MTQVFTPRLFMLFVTTLLLSVGEAMAQQSQLTLPDEFTTDGTANNASKPGIAPKSIAAGEVCNNNIDDDGDGLIDAIDPDCCGGWLTRGSAFAINSSAPYEYRLTTAVATQGGGIWSNSRLDFSQSFSVAFQCNLGNIDANGADGMAFVIHNDPLGYNAPILVGGGLGVGMTPCLATEFDTWDNGVAAGDIGSDHTAIYANNQANTIPGGTAIQASATNINIEDGAWHDVLIDWNVGTQTFTVTFDGVQRLQSVYDFIQNVFSGTSILYFGFTASTGAAFNVQQIRNIVVSGTRVEVCGDGIDNDCDALIDCADTDCQFTATASVVGSFHCNTSTVSLSATATSVIPNHNIFAPTYSWTGVNSFTSTSSTTSVTGVNSSADGIYTVTISGNNGCTATSSLTLNTTGILPAVMSSVPETCIDNGTATAAFPVPTSNSLIYSWTNDINAAVGGNTATITGLNTGIYHVTITDTGGCAATGTVSVGLDLPTLNVTPATATVCPGDAVQLDATYNSSVAVTGCGLGGTCSGTPNTFQVGQGTTGLQTLDGTPFNQFFKGSKVQYLFTAAELQAAGLRRGVISALDFEILTKNSTAPFTGMNISLGCTALTALGANFETGLSTVYTGNLTTSLGWNSIATNTYTWDGTANLIVEVCFTNPSFSFADFVSGGTTPFVSSLSAESDVNPGCGLAATRSSSVRPNIRFANCGVVTYVWNASSDLSSTTIANPIATPSQTTQTYTVIANDGNCPLLGTVVVNVSGGLSAPSDAGCTSVTYDGLTFNWNAVANATAYEVSFDGGSTWASANGTSHSVTGLTSNTATSITVRATGGNACPNAQTLITCTTAACFTATTTSTPASCFGNNNGTITVTANAPDNYSFELHTPAGVQVGNPGVGAQSFTFNSVSAGTYNVDILNNVTHCRTTVPVTVTEPVSQISLSTTSTPVACFGQSTGTLNVVPAGGSTPYNYTWSNSLPPNAIVTGVAAGNYHLTVTDINGCQSTAIVPVSGPAAALTATAIHADVACNGASTGRVGVTVSGGSGALSFNWNTPGGANTALVNNLAAGTYTVTVTDANGCTASSSTTINQGAPVSVTVVTAAEPCEGSDNGALNASATGGDGQSYTYVWSNTPATGAYNGSIGDGTYNVIVSDYNGCTASGSGTLVDTPLPNINIIFDNTAVTNATVYTGVNYSIQGNVSSTPEVGVNYTWTYAAPIVVNPSTEYSALVSSSDAATNQVVTLTADRNGCTISQSITLSFLPPVLRMPNAFTPGADSYNSVFKPAITGNINNITFSIFDRWGHIVHEEIVSNATQLVGWDGRYKNNDLPRDVYVWRVIYQEPGKPAATIKGGDVTLLW